MSKQNDAIREEAIRFLTTDPDGPMLKPGDTVYTILRHRSSSGMMRIIDLFVIRKNKYDGQQKPWRIGWKAAQAMGDTYDRERDGIKVGGCGMDMGFHLVYSLSSVLFPEGFGEIGYKLNANGEIDRTICVAASPDFSEAQAIYGKLRFYLNARDSFKVGPDSAESPEDRKLFEHFEALEKKLGSKRILRSGTGEVLLFTKEV